MEEIKNCPFCGKEPEIQTSYGAVMISCNTNGCSMGFVDENEPFADKTLKKWNTRPDLEKNKVMVNEVIQKAIGDIYDDLGTEPHKKVLSTQEVQSILIDIENLLIEALGD